MLATCRPVIIRFQNQRQKPTTRQATKLFATPTPDSAVFTPFLVAFASYMCPIKEAASYCLENQMIIPPYDEQVEIVKVMSDIADHVNISGADGAIFKLLLTHGIEKLNALISLLQEYRHLQAQISDIVSSTN
jgi:hypothetical protein